ncbi:hypothetical protein [Nocardia cyriacigeorgica]|uniref:hypothetical protein n=1 Tax=Nocardia cyriacigeorgica TaxID=135487 RepID=UPI0013D1E001|nr:hypothetical protein [Nocardia cyriacigeorgica]MBF6455378.1 hypothetical protein [Nocardia cyriacigeorgica]MBF6477548.1 hypothetical protein [Nocardia cyriacigeorgica]MBF6553880.1 hypothetical protein [Nocardia cyriacigeorgica]NEW29425.1 hypothetical protein [Nocardia cyriacigeorgica]
MDFGNNDEAATEYTPYPTGAHGAPDAWPSSYDAVPQQGPRTMPTPVRAAQILSWVFGAVGAGLIAVAVAADNWELVGALIGGYLPAVFLVILAFGFGVNGNGVRVSAIVAACLGMLLGLGAVTQGLPPGLLGVGMCLAIVILLSQRSAADWFQRPQ